VAWNCGCAKWLAHSTRNSFSEGGKEELMSRNICIALIAACTVGYIVVAQNGATISGQWTIGGLVARDNAQALVQLTIRRSEGNSNMSSSSPVPLSQLRGLTRAQLDSPGVTLRFELVRDAGTFSFEGYVQRGGGGGAFTFSPNPNFAGEMRSLGFPITSGEQQFVMAVHDASTAYVRDLQALGVRPASTDQLVTMRIHNVATEYVKDLRALGYTNLNPDQLVTMRIHNVTAEFARELNGLGYNSVPPDQLVTMRIHGATTEFKKKWRRWATTVPVSTNWSACGSTRLLPTSSGRRARGALTNWSVCKFTASSNSLR
jgi:hypothetical protein